MKAERDAALWRLAQQLFEAMERLEPRLKAPWAELTEDQRTHYLFAASSLFERREDILAVLGIGGWLDED